MVKSIALKSKIDAGTGDQEKIFRMTMNATSPNSLEIYSYITNQWFHYAKYCAEDATDRDKDFGMAGTGIGKF